MRILIMALIMWVVALTANAKCTLRDFNGDWRVMMTLLPLADPTGEDVAQLGGDIACTVRFDRRGQFVSVADNQCKQSGLNYSFGQIRSGSVRQTVPAAGSCQFQIVMDFDRDTSDQTQTVTLGNVYPDQIKVGFASDVDVAEPDDDVWHAGSAWGFKLAR